MRHYYFGFLMAIISCSSTSNEPQTTKTEWNDTTNIEVDPKKKEVVTFKVKIVSDSIPYSSKKQRILRKKNRLANAYENGRIDLDSVAKWFDFTLVNELIPYWYGTEWTFEGHTNEPQNGSVACGYFVSTTLKHFGTNVNRYKMAQQAALTGLKMICPADQIHRFSNDSSGHAASNIRKKLPDGLYQAGLDFHVGYLYLLGEEAYFIHSSYMDPVAVVIEHAETSAAFNNTNTVYVGRVSNKAFLRKWLRNEQVLLP